MASTAEQPDYVKFAEIQKTFWTEHKDCFLNDRQTVPVNISQCIIASDQFVIRTLQRDITEAVKKELIQLIDVKQRQKVCLTPVDLERQLLKTKLVWVDIKNGQFMIINGQFMIINGQHSITASQELQKEGCSEERREKLQH